MLQTLAITSAGDLGMVPSSSQIGDAIAGFHGSCVSIILQRDSENTYTLIDEEYVENVSYGEAVTWNEDEGDKMILI